MKVITDDCSFEGMIKRAEKKHQEAYEWVKEHGTCVHCHEGEVDLNNPLAPSPFQCEKCNEKIRGLLSELRGPGFMELSI